MTPPQKTFKWQHLPLYLQILIVLPFAVGLGFLLGNTTLPPETIEHLALPCTPGLFHFQGQLPKEMAIVI